MNLKTTEKKWSMLLYALLFAFVTWMSMEAPWIGDDIVYEYIWPDQTYTDADGLHQVFLEEAGDEYKIHTLKDIIVSQNRHYLLVNGRYVAHFLIQLFIALLGRIPFSLINGMAYIALVMLILRGAGLSVWKSRSVASVICLVLIFMCTRMTPAYQISYIWMYILIGWWCLYFINNGKGKGNPLNLICWFIVSLVVGNMHESLNIGVGGALIVYFLIRHGRLTGREWSMMIGFGIGALILCLSPAMLNRASGVEQTRVGLGPLIAYLGGFLTLVVVLIWKLRKIDWKNWVAEHRFWISVLVTLLLFFGILGIENNRQLFGITFVSIILILTVLKKGGFTNFWLGVYGIMTLCLIIWEISAVIPTRRQLDRVFEEYSVSTNGLVYEDIGWSDYYHLWPLYMSPIANEWRGDSFGAYTIARKARNIYPGKPELLILPTALRPLTETAGNQGYGESVIGAAPYGVWYILTNDTTKHYMAERSINLPGYKKPRSVAEISNQHMKQLKDSLWVTVLDGRKPLTTITRIWEKEQEPK